MMRNLFLKLALLLGLAIPTPLYADDIGTVVAIGPTARPSLAIPSVSASGAISALQIATGGHNLYTFYITSGSTAGQLILADSAAISNGGGTLSGVTVIDCIQVPANQTTSLSWLSGPMQSFVNGITAYFSTGGSCATLTPSATALFMKGMAR